VIPNGVESAAFSVPVQPHALRERCGGAAKGRPIFLYLSRLHPKKGITDILLPAVAQLPSDCFLAIAGGEDPHLPGYESTVRSAIDRLGLSDRVALIGEVSPGDRWAMFDGAAGFVLPSHSENFGIVVAEAMGRACPVVVTRAVNASEHVTAAAAGWVVDLTADSVACGMRECLAEPAAAREAGLRGRRYAEEHLSWDAIAGRIHGMYEDCVR
jgi:glycosyltransferase involved in cell wall biosynthesis